MSKLFEQVLKEQGSHDSKRINTPIQDTGKFPIESQKGIAVNGGNQKPAIKSGRGSPGAKHDFQTYKGENKPRCAREYDTYEAKYSKTGSLTEKQEYKEYLDDMIKLDEKITPEYPSIRECFDRVNDEKKRLQESEKKSKESDDDDETSKEKKKISKKVKESLDDGFNDDDDFDADEWEDDEWEDGFEDTEFGVIDDDDLDELDEDDDDNDDDLYDEETYEEDELDDFDEDDLNPEDFDDEEDEEYLASMAHEEDALRPIEMRPDYEPDDFEGGDDENFDDDYEPTDEEDSDAREFEEKFRRKSSLDSL
jgi:hypothetical protein